MEKININQFEGLWNAIATAPWYASIIISILGLIVIILFFLFISGNLGKVIELISKKHAKKKQDEIDSENWLSSKIKKVHIMPKEISYSKKDIEIHMKKFLRDIDYLRGQPAPAKSFVLSFADTIRINKEVSNSLIKFAKEGMDRNIVTLIYGFPKKCSNDLQNFKNRCAKLEKKHKNPSFITKTWRM